MLADNVVTNGTFESDLSGFTLTGGTCVWDDGYASFTGSGGRLQQSILNFAPQPCVIEFDVADITGTGFFYQGLDLISSPDAAGHYILYRDFSSVGYIAFGVNGTAKFGNISVRPIVAPQIAAIVESDGVVTLTVDAEGTVDIYGRMSGTSDWTELLADQAAGDVAVSSLTAGATWEFYVVEYYNSAYLAPSNIARIYVHDFNLPTVSEIESAAVGALNALGVFKTVGVWNWQISAEKLGTTVYDSLAPFAFVGEIPTSPAREGSMVLNRKIRLVVMIGQKSMTDGAARTGDATTVGVSELRALVIAALDQWHPGDGFDCDDFLVTDEEEVYKDARKYAVDVVFEANRIVL